MSAAFGTEGRHRRSIPSIFLNIAVTAALVFACEALLMAVMGEITGLSEGARDLIDSVSPSSLLLVMAGSS
jgi:hypothetical protein